jgi:hypothetical protein
MDEPTNNQAVPQTAADLGYPFSDREKAFFTRQLQQMNVLQSAIQAAIALVIEQQGLEGRWSLRADGSGLDPS